MQLSRTAIVALMNLGRALRFALSPMLKVFPNSALSPVLQFTRDGWNEKLYANLQLNRMSRVLDIGGFIGESTNEILSRFGSQIYCFEPVPEFVAILKERFEDLPQVKILGVGIGRETAVRSFSVEGDRTQVVRDEVNQFKDVVEVPFQDVSEIAGSIGWGPDSPVIDLAIVNIEGGEYELLSILGEFDLVRYVQTFLIQFHKISPDAQDNRSQARATLSRSHSMTWSYDWIWERWDKNPSK